MLRLKVDIVRPYRASSLLQPQAQYAHHEAREDDQQEQRCKFGSKGQVPTDCDAADNRHSSDSGQSRCRHAPPAVQAVGLLKMRLA
jgi:hypothetical protein